MSWHDCDRCGASYRSMRAALRCCEDTIITDGSGCFWCEGTTEYHPTCDSPDCNNQTHGHGSDGTTVDAYCADCKGVTVTDGGPSCNCAHIRGVCTECSPRVATDGGTVEEVAARAENLRYLAEAIEGVDWHEVPGVSPATAATFAQDLTDASDRLRRRHVDDEVTP